MPDHCTVSHSQYSTYGYRERYTPARMEKAYRDLVQKLMKDKGMDQVALETSSGVSQGLISRLIKDPTYSPSTVVFLKVLKGLGIAASDFFRRIEGQTNPHLAMPNDLDQNPPTERSQTEADHGEFGAPVSPIGGDLDTILDAVFFRLGTGIAALGRGGPDAAIVRATRGPQSSDRPFLKLAGHSPDAINVVLRIADHTLRWFGA